MALDTSPMVGDGWTGVGKYGTLPIEQSGGRAHIPHVQNSIGNDVPPWSPDNPLFWFGAILLATGVGLFAISGEVKVAKTKVTGAIGSA